MSAARRLTGRALRAALALATVGVAAGIVVPPAGAHASLLRSEPADAASVTKPPRLIRLWFSEELAPSVSRIQLHDGRGKPVAGTRLDVSAAGSGTLVLALPRLPRGVYSLDWRVLSEGDLHVSEGAIAFGVGTHAVPTGKRDPGGSVVGVVDVLFRWLGFVFLAGIVGGLAVATLVFAPIVVSARGRPVRAAAAGARTRVLACAAVCAFCWAVVGPGILLSQASSLASAGASAEGVAWRLLTETRWGSLWIARELLALALFGALLLLLREHRAARPWRGSLAVAVAVSLALALVAVQALSGHAFAVTPHRALALGVAGVHLLAALVWVGGLLVVLVSLGPLLGTHRSESAALARASLAPFSLLAAACVGLLAVTGLYYAGRQVASVDALLTTKYGHVLLGKLGLVLAVGAIGLLNALILRPQLADHVARVLGRPAGWTPLSAARLRSLLVAEAALGVALLLMVGLLTATPPARGPAFAQAPAATPSFRSGSAEDLLVSLSVKPNRPGANVFEVSAVSTRRPTPGPIERVRLRFTSSETSVTSPPLRKVEPGRYRSSGTYLGQSGAWRVETLVDRGGLGESRARFDWAVARSGAPRPFLVSRRPLEPILTRASVLLLFGLAVAGVWVLVRRMPRSRAGSGDPLILRRLEERTK